MAFGRVKKGRDLACLAAQCRNEELFQPYPDGSEVAVYDQQTYNQWKAVYDFHRVSHPIRVRQRRLLLQPLSYSSASYPCSSVDDTVLCHLRDFCQAYFTHMSVEVAPVIDLAELRVTSRVHPETQREQFLVGDILRELQRHRSRRAFAVLGITTVDLYPGGKWNFVLGQADFATSSGVSSLGRYFNSSSSSSTLGADSRQLSHLWVLIKVLSHELCHLFGLRHCYYFECAMNESSSISQASAQPLFLCPVCLRKLHKALGFNIQERYRLLLDQIRVLFAVMQRSAVDDSVQGEVLDGRRQHLQLMDSAARWLDKTLLHYDKY